MIAVIYLNCLGSLASWLPLLVDKVVPLSMQHPLLSGLYRLLTCALRVADYAFAALSTEPADELAADADPDAGTIALSDDPVPATGTSSALVRPPQKATGTATGTAQLAECAAALRGLMLSLQQRVSSSAAEFQQELLDAVLCLILSSPRSILPLHDVIGTVRLALVSGVQALLAVQLLTQQLLADKAALLPHLAPLLPLFDKYLSAGAGSSTAGEERDKLFLRSAAAMTKMARKGSQTASTADELEGAPYSVQVQYALLRLLGRLGGASQQILVNASETVQDALVWSDHPCLCIDLPASADPSAAMRVCLDVVLPRLVTLCDASSSGTVDPQALSAAAEALHALVLYMVGTASAVANARDKNTHFSALYERVFPTVIKLSVADFICRALFEKLLFQLIRWFSGHGQVSERDAGALLDALFNRLGDPAAEGAEREVSSYDIEGLLCAFFYFMCRCLHWISVNLVLERLCCCIFPLLVFVIFCAVQMCARGVLEFFLWAVKQSTKGELAKHPGNGTVSMRSLSLFPQLDKLLAFE